MRGNLVKKGLVLGIILLFVGASVIPTIGGTIGKLSGRVYTEPIGVFNGDTIYVDDDSTPPGNGTIEWPYCRIQHAIENASKGDTIYVCNGTYYENVLINEEVALYGGYEDLIGDDVDGSVIDGGGSGNVVKITADGVDISGFTIMNSDQWGNGITNDPFIPVENLFICGNIIKDCRFGILLTNCKRTVISRNTICDYISDGEGIHLYNSPNSEISKNIIQNTGVWGIDCYYINNSKILNNNLDKMKCGLSLCFSNDCEISRNNFTRTTIHGLRIWGSSHNIISENNIHDNSGDSIRLYNDSNYNKIFHNNYINNTQNAYDECSNTWDNGYPSGGNYWDDYTGMDSDGDGIGDTAYNISGGSNQDRYPFMNPDGWLNNPPNKPSTSYNSANDELIITATDPDGDQIRYGVSWDNDYTVDQWTDLVDSGTEQRIDCGGREGTVGVIAEDEHGGQSDWVSQKSKNKAINTMPVFQRILENHPHMFPILQQLLQRLGLIY